MKWIRRVTMLAASWLACTAPGLARADWQVNGTSLTPPPTEQWTPLIAPGARGGGLVGWTEQGTAVVQSLTSSGNVAPGWTASGFSLHANIPFSVHRQLDLVGIVPDGEGGAFVALYEQGPGGDAFDPVQLFLHHLTSTGARAPGWTAEGVRIQSRWLNRQLAIQNRVALCSDGGRGVLIAWLEPRGPSIGNARILAQSVTAGGQTRWATDGLELGSSAGALLAPALVGEQRGGALVFWGVRDSGAAEAHVVGQRVTGSGMIKWSAQGRLITREGFDRLSGPVAVSDGERGAVVAWVGSQGRDLDVYGARVTPGGGLPWRPHLKLCSAPGDQSEVAVIPTGRGGALAVWLDGRSAPDIGVFAQRISSEGRPEWARNGVAVCSAPGSRSKVAIASDGHEGAFVAWADTRVEGELFANRVTSNGERADGWPVHGAVVSQWPTVLAPYDQYQGFGALSITSAMAGTAIVAWQDLRAFTPPGGDMNRCFAMLLTPRGPAASPVAIPSRGGASAGMGRGAPSGAPVFALRSVFPNPSTNAGSVRFALPDGSAATLELLDLSGRRLWSRDVGAWGAGEHEARLADGIRLPPGNYFVRLVRAGQSAVARIAVIK